MTRHITSHASSVASRRRPPRLRWLGEPFTFRGRSVVAVHSGYYRNGQVRLDVVDERTGALVLTPTAPADDYVAFRRRTVLLSDAAACRGIVAELEKAGVVNDTGVMIDDRNGRLHVCEFASQAVPR